MKIIIPGGSGQVGAILGRFFLAQGHEVVVFSRKPTSAPWRMVEWNAETLGDWRQELEGADAVINLAGRSVNCRYHARNRREILESRVKSTRVIGEALGLCCNPPKVWLQSSTATIYAHRYDAPNDEFTGILGGDEPRLPDTWKFSLEVAKAWEQTTIETQIPGIRKVLMRTALLLSPDAGGIFDVLMGLVRKGLGGFNGDGRQFVSWIHEMDFTRAVLRIIEDSQFEGPVNIASPNPLCNREFMRILRREAKVPFGLPATKWMLEIGAFLMCTETELILKSRRVVPVKLLEAGFDFQYPTWPEAARELCGRWRK